MRVELFNILALLLWAPPLAAAETRHFANPSTVTPIVYWASISPLIGYNNLGGPPYLTDYLNSSEANNISAAISLHAVESSGLAVGLTAARASRVGWDNFPNDIVQQFDEATLRCGFAKVEKQYGWLVEGGAGIGQWSLAGPDRYVRGDVGVLVLHTKTQWALPVEAQYFVRGWQRFALGISAYATYTVDKLIVGSRINFMFGRFN